MFRKSTVCLFFLLIFNCGDLSKAQLLDILSVNNLLSLPKYIEYNYNYNSTVSDLCKEELRYLEDGISRGDDWALDMIDASSTTPPSGMRKGSFYDIGQFDECYQIKHPIRRNLTIYGKYCFGIVGMGNMLLPEAMITQTIRVGGYIGIPHAAICVPSGCDANDINILYKNNSFAVGERYCYSKDELPSISKGAIATLVFLGFLVGIIVISTSYEAYLKWFNKEEPHETLTSFSVIKNYKSLTKISFSSANIGCLCGIKFLSTLWVLYGHEFLNGHDKPINNQYYVEEFRHKLVNAYVYGGTVAVDTFFTVAGLLVVYISLGGYDAGRKFNFFFALKHRYLRLTPLLAVCMLVTAQLADYAGSGPVWGHFYYTAVRSCEMHWWRNLIYLQNFLSDYDDAMCLGQTWYLAPDMHYFIIAFLLTYPLYKWPKWTLYFLYFLVLLGFAVPFGITMYYNILVTASRDYMIVYYMSSFTRFGPYVIGMLCGYVLYLMRKHKYKIQLSTIWVVTYWPVVLGVMYLCMYYDYILYMHDSQVLHSMYMACIRNVWAFTVCTVILACHSGHGGFINTFLSNSFFQIATRLSYAMYLIHYEVQQISSYSAKYVYDESTYNNLFMFLGNGAITIFYSLIAWFMIEAPMAILEPYIFGPGPGKKKPRKTENSAKEIEQKTAEPEPQVCTISNKNGTYIPHDNA